MSTITRVFRSAYDAVDGSSAGIAMCHIALVILERRMSPFGTQETIEGTVSRVRCQMHCRRLSGDVGFFDVFVCSGMVNRLTV